MPLLEFMLHKKAMKIKSEEVHQGRLRKMTGLEDENVVIIEKSNMAQFLIRTCGNIIRITATITILALAFAGLTALVYPGPRLELLAIAQEVARQLMVFLGGG